MNEKIEIIYRILMSDLILTNKVFLEYGLSEEEINTLVEMKFIRPNNNETYNLVSVDKFRRYGINLLKNKQTREANICFRKCYELAPNGKDICLQVMLAAIKIHNYEKAFEIFANLEKIHPELNSMNNNLYLYLLSIITDCPKEYTDRVRMLEIDDLMLPNVIGNKPENEVRSAILRNKYTFAFSKINEIISRGNNYSVKFELLKELLFQTVEHEKNFKKELLFLAKQQQYEEIISILKNRQQQRYLGNLETYILLISEGLVNLVKTKTIPIITINATCNIYEALI